MAESTESKISGIFTKIQALVMMLLNLVNVFKKAKDDVVEAVEDIKEDVEDVVDDFTGDEDVEEK